MALDQTTKAGRRRRWLLARRALPTAARRYRWLGGRRRRLPETRRRADAQPGDGLARGARTQSLELVGVAGGVCCLMSRSLPRLCVDLAQARGFRRRARVWRTGQYQREGKGRSILTAIARRSRAAALVVAGVNEDGDLGHEQANQGC